MTHRGGSGAGAVTVAEGGTGGVGGGLMRVFWRKAEAPPANPAISAAKVFRPGDRVLVPGLGEAIIVAHRPNDQVYEVRRHRERAPLKHKGTASSSLSALLVTGGFYQVAGARLCQDGSRPPFACLSRFRERRDDVIVGIDVWCGAGRRRPIPRTDDPSRRPSVRAREAHDVAGQVIQAVRLM
jgi:hypothetical protein